MVQQHLDADPDNEFPLSIWVHHREVALALAEQLEELGVTYGMIDGDSTTNARQRAVDDFQNGAIRVVIASITAAGVGVTLTRGCDALFVEVDWNSAIVAQAIDRHHRIGQERPVLARILVAMNTLDERIQKILAEKDRITEKITGDDAAKVSMAEKLLENMDHGKDLISPQELVRQLVTEVLKHRRR
jgi:SNF2 family DNA or RNA helicase